MKRVWIVWLWYISQYFISAIEINTDLILTSVCDINLEILATYKQNNKDILIFTDYREICPYIDCVIITTPNYLHYEIIDFFLDNNIDVLCEKPLTLEYMTTKLLIEKAKNSWLVLQTAFHRRYNKNFLSRKLSLNKIKNIKIRYLENIILHSFGENWYCNSKKSWGWCIIDNGINALDILYSLVWPYDLINYAVWFNQDWNDKYDENAILYLQYEWWKCTIELDWKFNWEIKDVHLVTEDGIMYYNFLEWFVWFKSSLNHEYDGIVKDFLYNTSNNRSFYDNSSLLGMSVITNIYNSIYN